MSLFEKTDRIGPGAGGCCIGAHALKPADVIVSATKEAVSGVIRIGTASVVSHAALFGGGREMIEAIEEGVVRRSLEAGLADDALAVVYRHPDMKPPTARKSSTGPTRK